MALAREHGFADDEGQFALGRFVTGGVESGAVTIRFITPVPAGLETEDLRPKSPPILFDRTPDGQIVVPGRWWQHTWEKVAEAEGVPDDIRRTAVVAARTWQVGDAYLPSDTDTIEILAADRAGNLVAHEALLGTVCRMRLTQSR